jgi:hypothetical protein
MRPAEAVGEGNCSAPVPVPGTMDMYTSRCISLGWAMKPGDVVNSFYSLPMPYPEDALIATVNQSVQLVDDTMRPVPLSEMYVHHVFGDSRNVLGEVRCVAPLVLTTRVCLLPRLSIVRAQVLEYVVCLPACFSLFDMSYSSGYGDNLVFWAKFLSGQTNVALWVLQTSLVCSFT